MAETSRTDPDDAPQRTRRHARAGRATRSTMGLRSAAWNIAPWLRDSLWHVLPPRFKVADVRRSIHSWLNAIYASAERDNERPQRGPQDVDPPDQRIGSAALNAMYESPDINFVPETESSSSTHRSRSPPNRREGDVREQEEMHDAEAMDALYGIGFKLVMKDGWKFHERLGVRGHEYEGTHGLLAPVTHKGRHGKGGLG